MTARNSTMRRVLQVLSTGSPLSSAEIVELTGLHANIVWAALRRYWHKNLILRTLTPLRKQTRTFKGRAGIRRNLRSYHLYSIRTANGHRVTLSGLEFVSYDPNEHSLNKRFNSKADSILRFLKDNPKRAFYATDITKTLAGIDIKPSDVMSNVRRWEKKGWVLVRGYRMDDRQTPFKEGYLIVWIDPSVPRDDAIKEAIEKTENALAEKESTNPTIQRVHRIRDLILEASTLREVVSFTYICESLDCSKYEAEVAVARALQLYSDLRETKLFKAFRYFYCNFLAEDELHAAVAMKENYIRLTKGKANRIGHNWEAVAEWFIDKFTTGAHFWTQNHRLQLMDPRRITIHLVRSTNGRIRNAEVDRVWEVTPGIFSPLVTYVLSCKWGLIYKRDVDDFFNVLRWSKEFGANTVGGQEIKQGIVGVFAGNAFNPNENVRLKDDHTITLSAYASRLNIQLLKAADFNGKLYDRGVSTKITVQKICKIAKNEKQVREILENIWKNANESELFLDTAFKMNKEVYDFEHLLEIK